MSHQTGQSGSKTPASIKLAAKEASQRHSAGAAGGADPGPGDPSAAPSVAPQLVDIPDAPTSSQLVVKSADSRKIATLHEGRSGTQASNRGPKSTIMSNMSGSRVPSSKHSTGSGHDQSSNHNSSHSSAMGGGPTSNAPHEPTSSKPLSGPGVISKSTISGGGGTGRPSGASPASGAGRSSGGPGGPGGPTSPATVSTAMQADSGAVVHDEDEEGEGELEQPEEAGGATTPGGTPASPSGASPAGSATAPSGLRTSSLAGKTTTMSQRVPPSAAKLATEAPSSVSGASRASIPSGAAGGASEPSKIGAPASSTLKGSSATGFGGTGALVEPSSTSTADKDKKKKKVTKFRYHKRITVRTSGKTSPTQIMDKVNKKDHRAGITPSQIEEMDPQELMKRAGIKANKKTHWRVRLRQTKRLTKGGKTTTQTKVAYRDSEGNKRIKTSSTPYCKNCSKKLEECRCDQEDSQKD